MDKRARIWILLVVLAAFVLSGCQSTGSQAQNDDVGVGVKKRIELTDGVEPHAARFVDNEYYLVAGSLKDVETDEQNRDWLMLGRVSNSSLYTIYVNDILDYGRLSVAPIDDGCLVQDVWTSDRANDLLKINFADNSAEEYSLPYALQLTDYVVTQQQYYLDDGKFLICTQQTDSDDDRQVSTDVRIWKENVTENSDDSENSEANSGLGDVIATLDGNISDVAWAQTGKSLLILSDNGDLVLLDVEQETASVRNLPETAHVAAWKEYSQVFSLADNDMAAVSVQCDDGEVVQVLKLGQEDAEAYEFKIFADNGKSFSFLGANGDYVYLLTTDDAGVGEVFYWDYMTDKEGTVFSTEADGFCIFGGSLSPDGKTLALAAKGESNNSGCVFLLDLSK